MKLTDKQKHVLYKIVSDVRKGVDEVKMAGYAGTGKSTLIKYLIKFFPEFAVCAYTGKAANVLREKGIDQDKASTIHSLIYTPQTDRDGTLYFALSHGLWNEGIIIDEASMVSEDIYYDLKSFNIPLIFIGDHGQLEPVGSDFNIMKDPNYVLEEIHRNAGEIARFGEFIRRGYNTSKYKVNDNSKIEFVTQRSLSVKDYLNVDQIICAFNKTRVKINQIVREAQGYSGTINIGEKIMCLKNNKTLRLFNGMQGIVTGLHKGKHGKNLMDFKFGNEKFENIWYDTEQFGKEKYKMDKYDRNSPSPFDYASCITCHKSQGDQWDKVLVLEQKCRGWDHKRWAYTAATRAKNHLKWAY